MNEDPILRYTNTNQQQKSFNLLNRHGIHRNRLKSYSEIHRHCFTCIRPHKCIRIPVSFNQAQLSLEEKYSMILDVNYYHHDDDIKQPVNTISNNNNEERKVLEFCPVVRCTNEQCEMVMHYCKLKEHFLLCNYQTVPCINSHYGCPYLLLRGQMSQHLSSHCPANVVHCSAEWNRWPLHTSEKSPQAQVFCSPHSLNIHNLDVALALRDQRMLKQLWSASRQMKRIMRGCLSTHPAVPIKPYIGIRTFREFRTNAQTNQNADGSSSQSFGLNICDNIDEEKYINYAAKLVEHAYRESLVEILRQTANYYRRTYYENSYDYRQQQQSRKKSNSICCQMSSISASRQNQISNNLLSPLSPGKSFPSSSSINLPILTDPYKLFLAAMNSKKDKENLNKKKSEMNQQTSLQQFPPPPPVPKCNMLSLEISIRSYAFHQPKPRAMYTFRCGMDFRKDELAAHSRDVHSDIHGGLDGWIEHRCPLFQYGCTFVHRRLSPRLSQNQFDLNQSTIVYNESLETFACCSFEYQQDISQHQQEEQQLTIENGNLLEKSISGRPWSSISSESDDLEDNHSHQQPKTSTSSNNNSSTCDGGSDFGSSNIPSLSSSYSLLSNNSSVPLLMSEAITASSNTTAITSSRSSSRKSSSHYYPSLMITSLHNLPFEILQNICKYLDGFSLNNLSFTSKQMRTVVQSFVKKKGYVVLQWKRFEMEKGKYRWRVVYKKWLFSTAMQPIQGWRLDSDNVMAQHLKLCPFYERNVHKEPFRLCLFNPGDQKKTLRNYCQ